MFTLHMSRNIQLKNTCGYIIHSNVEVPSYEKVDGSITSKFQVKCVWNSCLVLFVETVHLIIISSLIITATSNGRHDILNCMSIECLVYSLFRLTLEKHQRHYCPFVKGIHRRPVDPSHKGTMTRKKVPCYDAIMLWYPILRCWLSAYRFSILSLWISLISIW